jgi:hypothetical protein
MKRFMPLLSSLVVVVVVLVLLLGISSSFMYVFAKVDQQEVGVRFRGGQIVEVVGAGLYSDFGLYVQLKRISLVSVPFSVEDPEVITKDKQRIGATVNGDVFRPTDHPTIRNLWAQYSDLFLKDDALKIRVDGLARQALKSCIGDRTFDQNVIGSARDDLLQCIDKELSRLAEAYGLEVKNVVVPNIILSAEVQQTLDAVTKSRLDTEKAAQDKLKADAEAQANKATQEGQVMVEQARIQEETRQKTIALQLEYERLKAEQSVIEAQKANDLLGAQKDYEIAVAKAKAAAEQAKADLALKQAEAQMYGANPAYAAYLMAQANASALKATDKVIFTPEGTMPTIVLAGPGIAPVVNTTQP